MGGGAYRITHVVQAIEDGDEVVVLSRILLGRGLLERNPIGDTCKFGGITGCFDRFIVIIESEELRLRECFCHQDSRSALPAAYVRDPRAGFEFFLHICKRGNPRAH